VARRSAECNVPLNAAFPQHNDPSVTRFTLLLTALLLGGCTTHATTHAETANAAVSDSAEWTDRMLRKLDSDLRLHVRRGDTARVAIKVYFRGNPSDEELATLLLSRVGSQVIGHVEPATLQSIASRNDVEHIEALRDTGY